MLKIINFTFARKFSKFVSIEEKTPESLLGPGVAESITEYTKAMEYCQKQNWQMAEEELQKVSQILSNTGHHAEPSHNFILQRIALTQRSQRKFKDCEVSLEKIVENYRQKYPKYINQLEFSYLTLYKQYLSSNLTKALRLGEILQREKHWNTLKKETQKNVKFMYAVISKQTALVLQGKDYPKAKKVFNELIKMNPEGNTCFVLNNLAVAQWLHAQKWAGVNVAGLNASQEEEFRRATTEFTEAVPNLQKAIQLFESFPEIYTLESQLNFKNKLTGLSLTNIGEIYLEKIEPETAHKWLKVSLEFYETLDKGEIGRTLTLIGTLMKAKGDLKHSEAVLKSAIEMLGSRRSFNEVLALEGYASVHKLNGGSEEEVETYREKAREVANTMPAWYERMIYLHVPEWSL